MNKGGFYDWRKITVHAKGGARRRFMARGFREPTAAERELHPNAYRIAEGYWMTDPKASILEVPLARRNRLPVDPKVAQAA